MRKTAVASGVIGVILVVAAFLLAFWITPAYVARLQSNTNIVRNYDGQIRTLLNPVALSQGNFAGAVKVGLLASAKTSARSPGCAECSAMIRSYRVAATFVSGS